jgi:hypothetical protein
MASTRQIKPAVLARVPRHQYTTPLPDQLLSSSSPRPAPTHAAARCRQSRTLTPHQSHGVRSTDPAASLPAPHLPQPTTCIHHHVVVATAHGRRGGSSRRLIHSRHSRASAVSAAVAVAVATAIVSQSVLVCHVARGSPQLQPTKRGSRGCLRAQSSCRAAGAAAAAAAEAAGPQQQQQPQVGTHQGANTTMHCWANMSHQAICWRSPYPSTPGGAGSIADVPHATHAKNLTLLLHKCLSALARETIADHPANTAIQLKHHPSYRKEALPSGVPEGHVSHVPPGAKLPFRGQRCDHTTP